MFFHCCQLAKKIQTNTPEGLWERLTKHFEYEISREHDIEQCCEHSCNLWELYMDRERDGTIESRFFSSHFPSRCVGAHA